MKIVKNNLDRFFLVITLVVLIIILTIYAIDTFKKKKDLDVKVIKEVSGYYLNDNDSDIYVKEFDNLYNILTSDEIDEEEYAKSISKLFVIDFYTLNNKITNMDIGGIQYIYSAIKDNFITKSSNTIYKEINNGSNWPIVSKVDIKEINKINFEYNTIKDPNSYEIVIDIDYEKDLEYPKQVKLTLIHEHNKLVIVEVK